VPCRKAASALLEFVASIAVPGIERFAAAEFFRENQPASELQISWIGESFRRQFVPKVELSVPAQALDVFRLQQSANDDKILAELGGRPEVTLHDIWTLLVHQSRGQSGPLLTDSTPNVFYVRDSMRVMWAVDAVWNGAGWEIGASALNDARPWAYGRQIISHRLAS
jgi:hypothetical protein